MALLILAATAWGIDRCARALHADGQRLRSHWRLDEACTSLGRARAIERLAVWRSDSTLILDLAECEFLRGRYMASRSVLAPVSNSEGVPTRALARARWIEGGNEFFGARSEAALAAYEATRKLATAAGDADLADAALIGAARVLYHVLGRHDEALESLRGVERSALHRGASGLVADARRHIGVIRWWFLSEQETVVDCCWQPALDAYRTLGDRRAEAIMLSNLALLHRRADRPERFQQLQSESLAIRREIGDLAGVAESERHLAEFYVEFGNLRAGLQAYERALRISRANGHRLLEQEIELGLARIAGLLGEHDTAMARIDALLRTEADTEPGASSSVSYKYQLASRAEWNLSRGRPDLALANLESARRAGAAIAADDPGFEVASLATLARAYLDLGNLEAADQFVRKAQSALDAASHGNTAELRVATHGLLRIRADLARARLRFDEAFRLLQGAVREETGGHRFALGHPWLASHEQDTQIWQATLDLLLDERWQPDRRDERIFDVLTDRKDSTTAAALARLGRSESGARSGDPSAALAARRGALHERTLLVEYFAANRRVFALLLDRAHLEVISLDLRLDQIEPKVHLLRGLLFEGEGGTNASPRDGEVWHAVSRELGERLVLPLRASGRLEGVERLGVVPFGALHDLPFAALLPDPGSTRFLIEQVAIFHVATAAPGEHSIAPSVPKLPGLAFGRSRFEGGLADLPSAASEALAVAGWIGGLALVDDRATETAIKRMVGRRPVLHLATHGFENVRAPLLGGLRLAADAEEDGRLSIQEILRLQLDPEMVFLGACRTGRRYSLGSNPDGLDRFGLVEAFVHIGAEHVVASHSDVRDDSTPSLAGHFYDALPEHDAVLSLALAQRALLRETTDDEPGRWVHPRHWAPYFVVRRLP